MLFNNHSHCGAHKLTTKPKSDSVMRIDTGCVCNNPYHGETARPYKNVSC